MESAPLLSPANQQAHDKIRGYAFQCWLTVEAWLQLGAQDTLFVECAEDFATFTPAGDANLVQAKATASPITLRSGDVVEAIKHYWEFRTKSQSGKVHYSFLTTSGITTEEGDPLAGTPGLKLWQEVSTSGHLGKAEELRKFLATDVKMKEKLHGPVLGFLESATAAECLEKLFRPVIWETDHPDMAGVRESIESQLATLVETNFAASPTHRHNLADSLFTKINTVAAAKEKLPLTRGLLLTTTENHLLPAGQMALAARNQEILGGMMVGGSTSATVWAFTEAVPPITLADDYSRRQPALKALLAAVGDAPFALIEGSSGMGKSTLAQIFSANAGGHWLHFRAQENEVVRSLRGIQLCTAIVAREPAPFGLIIDDLPWALLDGTALGTVRGLVRAARRRGARLVFTNQRAPSAVSIAAAGLSDLVAFKAPVMEQEEIVEVAVRLGCADREKATQWAPLIAALSSGHPRLVHANLIGLKGRGWPAFSAEEFQAANASLQQARDESQMLLSGRRAEEIELLTRLSAFFGPFRRDQALTIAEGLERIVGASVAFEHLLGPWIEPFSQDRYQLSPLLGKTLLNGLSDGRAREVHRAAIVAVVTAKPIEAGDATGALLNAVLGGAADHAAGLLMKFLMAPREHSAALHSHLVWVTLYATEGQPIFTGFPAVDFMFRILQFEVAASVSPDKTGHFLQLCDQMLAKATDPLEVCSYRTMLAYSFLKTNQATIPFARLFWSIGILKQAMSDMREEGLQKLTKLLPPELNPEGVEDESEVFVVLEIWTRASTFEGLRALLTTLQQADEATRASYLAALSRAKPSAIMCFDQVWLAEDKKAQRHWEPILALFYDFLAAAEAWKSDLLAACSARGVSVIHDEYQDRTADAEKALARVIAADPSIQAIVTERRAKSAMLAKQYEAAQKLFEAAIPHSPWIGFTAAGTVALYQNAGTAAGKAGNWSTAAKHFSAGSELAKKDNDPVSAFALLADAGYATWQSGDKPQAVTQLGTAFDMIPGLPAPTTLRTRRTLRFFGHLLTTLAWDGTARSGQSTAPTVYPGMCSEARDDVNGPKLTAPDFSLQEIIYLTLVFQHLPQSPQLETRLAKLLQDASPLTRYFAWELQARRLMRSGEPGKLFECLTALSAEVQLCNQLKLTETGVLSQPATPPSGGPITLDQPFPNSMLLMCGLTFRLLAGDDLTAVLKSWMEAAKGNPLEAELLTFFAAIETALTGTLLVAANGAASEPNQFVRWAHALRLLQEPKPPANALLIATIYFTFHHWEVTRYIWLADLTKVLDKTISEKWKQACDQRFQFKSPTLFVPDIKALAGAPDGTTGHIARLAMAAQPAVSLNIDSSIIQSIRGLATGKPNPAA